MVKEAKKKCYGKWNIPAGHLERGETIFEGAIREIFEETGCKVRLKNVLPVMSKDIENTTLIIITFTTELLEENISFDEKEILDVKWISKEELLNMPDEKLRDEKRIRRTLKIFEENKVYPLDAVKILEDINSQRGVFNKMKIGIDIDDTISNSIERWIIPRVNNWNEVYEKIQKIQ